MKRFVFFIILFFISTILCQERCIINYNDYISMKKDEGSNITYIDFTTTINQNQYQGFGFTNFQSINESVIFLYNFKLNNNLIYYFKNDVLISNNTKFSENLLPYRLNDYIYHSSTSMKIELYNNNELMINNFNHSNYKFIFFIKNLNDLKIINKNEYRIFSNDFKKECHIYNSTFLKAFSVHFSTAEFIIFFITLCFMVLIRNFMPLKGRGLTPWATVVIILLESPILVKEFFFFFFN